MFFKIDKLKRIENFSFKLGTILIEAKDEKEFLFILFSDFSLLERFIDWKYSLLTTNNRFSGSIMNVHIDVFNIYDSKKIKNIIENNHEEFMKFIKNDKSYIMCNNPFKIKLEKEKDIIIKKSLLIHSFFYHKNNPIERFIKHGLFDKNLLNLIEKY